MAAYLVTSAAPPRLRRLGESHVRAREQLYIGGKWVAPSGRGSIGVIDAATEETIGRIPSGNEENVDRAVQAAARAFPGWAATPVAERARWLERIKEGLASRAEEIATTISAEVGSPIAKARRAPECAIDPPAACSSHATMVASEGVPVHKSGFGLLLAFASCSAVYFSWASSLARIAAFSEIQCRTGAY